MDAARGLLGDMTCELALLVVLDDIWEPAAVDLFTGLGLNCRALITTRDVRVLDRANADRYDLGLLSQSDAREFLATATGLTGRDNLPLQVDAIIDHCGRLPLALAAAGALIARNRYDWADVLQAADEGATEELEARFLLIRN